MCKRVDSYCDNTKDSIIVKTITERIPYDTTVYVAVPGGFDFGEITDPSKTDTIWIETEVARAGATFDGVKLSGFVENKTDSLQALIRLYKYSYTTTRDSYTKLQATCNYKDVVIADQDKQLSKTKAWLSVWRWIAIILLSLLAMYIIIKVYI